MENKDRFKQSDKIGEDSNNLAALRGSPHSVVIMAVHYITYTIEINITVSANGATGVAVVSGSGWAWGRKDENY